MGYGKKQQGLQICKSLMLPAQDDLTKASLAIDSSHQDSLGYVISFTSFFRHLPV